MSSNFRHDRRCRESADAFNIVARRAAEPSIVPYSTAVWNTDGLWARATLALWLAGCQLVFPLGNPDEPDPGELAVPHLEDPVAIEGDDLTLSGTLDTTGPEALLNGLSISSRLIDQHPLGDQLMVIVAPRIEIQGVRVTGAHALVLVANDIDVMDSMDVSADHELGGPGGSSVGMGGSGTRSVSDTSDGGGGGGGAAGAGGAGGNGRPVGGLCDPAPGGVAGEGIDPELTVLRGGGRGGSGSVPCGGTTGGGGGGAIQLSARRVLSIGSSIDAGGGGGLRGIDCSGAEHGGGGGGGAGGSIFLDAAVIQVAAVVSANGGGGGAGGDGTAMDGQDGSSAGGGGGGGTQSLDGGGGGGEDGARPPGDGGTAAVCGGNGGGGGGAGGRIVTRTNQLMIIAGQFSPPALELAHP